VSKREKKYRSSGKRFKPNSKSTEERAMTASDVLRLIRVSLFPVEQFCLLLYASYLIDSYRFVPKALGGRDKHAY